MSHIHIPDGVLPWWLWVPGWLLALVLVAFAGWASQHADVRRKVPLLSIVSALMLVAMSSEIIPIAYHVNLTVLGGVLLGPVLSIIAAFIVEVVLAMLGHGGVTVLGLNTVVIAAEMIVGWALFRGFVAMLGRPRSAWAAGVATVLALAVSTTLLVGIVAIAGAPAATERETGALDTTTWSIGNPFAEGAFKLGLFSGGEAHGVDTGGESAPKLSVARFAAVVYTLGPIGWLLEALITAAIVGFIAKVRPGLLWSSRPRRGSPVPPGDEEGRR